MTPLRAKKTVGLIALLLFVACRLLFDALQTDSNAGRHVLLIEGDYQIIRVVDAVTWIVKPVNQNSPPFRVRLASLDVASAERRTLAKDNELIQKEIGPDRMVHLRFDRHRFDSDQVPLAYAFVDDVLINAKLVAFRLAIPRILPDNSAKLQRQIVRAAESRGDGP